MINTNTMKRFRLLNDYTQKEIASFLNIRANAYSLKENGKTKFTLEEVAKLAKLYNIKIEDFFNC